MGTQLLTDPEVAELCDRCSAGADVDLRHLLVRADDDELRLTQNAQPALCFVGLALTLLLKRRGIEAAPQPPRGRLRGDCKRRAPSA
jgi:malonyl CoA-acyl carrier protein transacylase